MATPNSIDARKPSLLAQSSVAAVLAPPQPQLQPPSSVQRVENPNGCPKLIQLSSAVIGSTVHLQTREGTLWEGILASFTPEFAVCLDLAIQIDLTLGGRDFLYQAVKNGSKTREKVLFELKDIARLTVVDIDLALAAKKETDKKPPADTNVSMSNNSEHKEIDSYRQESTPTALVIIPQHTSTPNTGAPAASSTPIPIMSTKPAIISTKTVQIPTTLTSSNAHVSLPISSSVTPTLTSTTATTQSHSIHMQTPVTGISPSIVQVPMTAHQNTSLNQTALVDRPPQTVPIVPITSKSTSTPTTLATSAVPVALPTSLVTTTTMNTSTPGGVGGVGIARTQPHTIQMQAPVTTIVPNLVQVPIAAHQNISLNQGAMINGPPQTMSTVPITAMTSSVVVKQEPTRHPCCLLDNGVRCDRVAGNASFSARIQKIVGTKKLNFALDQTARHTYICDHHKAIITVAKKSTAIAREPKANSRNFTANNNANTPLAPQHTNNLSELTLNQPTMQMNLDLLSSQNRLANNHPAAVMGNVPMRPGAQIAYGHYPGPHSNQVVPMDTMMTVNYDNTGGDTLPPNRPSVPGVDVDLQQLQVNTLRRYKRHFRVQTRPGLNKMQLAESLKHHFRTLPINEKEAITYFVYIVKCSRNKLDHNPKAD